MVSQETRKLLKNLSDTDIHIRITIFESRLRRYKRKIGMKYGYRSEMGKFFMDKTEEALRQIREHEMILHERQNRIG